MRGRRGTGVERRKGGHSWYQSAACYILFFLSSLMPCGVFFFLSMFALLPQVIAELCLMHMSHSVPQSGVARELAQFCLHPSSSFTPCLAQQVHGWTLLRRTQGDTWLLGHRWPAASPGPSLAAASWPPSLLCTGRWVQTSPPWSLVFFQCDSNLWLCCEGYWNGWLTHFQLTDTIIHCLYWELWVCACLCACARALSEQCLLDSLPDIFLPGQHRLSQGSIMEE